MVYYRIYTWDIYHRKWDDQWFIADWWFGTMEFFDFPYLGNFIIPTFHISDFIWALRPTSSKLMSTTSGVGFFFPGFGGNICRKPQAVWKYMVFCGGSLKAPHYILCMNMIEQILNYRYLT